MKSLAEICAEYAAERKLREREGHKPDIVAALDRYDERQEDYERHMIIRGFRRDCLPQGIYPMRRGRLFVNRGNVLC